MLGGASTVDPEVVGLNSGGGPMDFHRYNFVTVQSVGSPGC